MEIFSTDSEPVQIRERQLRSEGEIHDFVESQLGIKFDGLDVFIINSEESTRTGVRADILGLAETGHPVIIELKQAGGGRKGSRTALVQALEYAADFRSENYQTLSNKYAEYAKSEIPLNEAHAKYFDLNESLSEGTFTRAIEPRILLLAEDFKASDIDAARYLRDANDVDITCIGVTPFEFEDNSVYGFETRLESKNAPQTPLRSSDDKALPWLIERLENSYYQRFGEAFEIPAPENASERQAFHQGNRFVSRPSHPDSLCYSFKTNAYDEPPKIYFGVSPRGNSRVEEIVDENIDELPDGFERRDRKFRRIRNENGSSIDAALSAAQLEVVSPEVSETIGRVVWESDQFQEIWEEFLSMVERWDGIIHSELQFQQSSK